MVFNFHSRYKFENRWGKLIWKTKYRKNTMQYNMCKRPHIASSKKLEGLILFHEGLCSLGILWTPLFLNVWRRGAKGYVWDNIWCLKFFCKCCTNCCYPTNGEQLQFMKLIMVNNCSYGMARRKHNEMVNTLLSKVALYLYFPLQSCWCN